MKNVEVLKINTVYDDVKKYLWRTDTREKKIGFLLPLALENLEKNTVAVKEFQREIVGEYLQSKAEWVAGLCAMWLYDVGTQKITEDSGCEDLVRMVVNNSCKWL